MPQEICALYSEQRYASSVLEKSEFGGNQSLLNELLRPQKGSTARMTHMPRAQEATCHQLEGATRECAVRQDLENGFCTSNESVKEPLGPQDRCATRKIQKRTTGGFLGEGSRCSPMVTGVLILLLVLIPTLVVALAVQSETSCGDTPVAPVTPVTPDTPLLLACSKGWVGYNGVCYFLSKDQGSWDQGQDRCSELRASLAMPKDEEMEFLFRLSGSVDSWLGLHRQGQRLQWADGSNFSSLVPVLGNGECVYLADNKFGSTKCSNQMPYLCSRPQTHL